MKSCVAGSRWEINCAVQEKLLWISLPCAKRAAQRQEKHSIRESLSWWAPLWVNKSFLSGSGWGVFTKTTSELLTMHASILSRSPLGIVKRMWDHRWLYCMAFPPSSWNAEHFGSSGIASVLKWYLCCSGGSYVRCLQLAHQDAHGLPGQKRALWVFKTGQIPLSNASLLPVEDAQVANYDQLSDFPVVKVA